MASTARVSVRRRQRAVGVRASPRSPPTGGPSPSGWGSPPGWTHPASPSTGRTASAPSARGSSMRSSVHRPQGPAAQRERGGMRPAVGRRGPQPLGDAPLGKGQRSGDIQSVIRPLLPARVPASRRWAVARGRVGYPSRDEPVPIEAERRGEKKRTKASRDVRRNSASERPIWRVRGRPGRPLRRGRSSACASRLTAIRTAALRVGSPAMVSYPSCRKWYRSHQSNTSASVIWLVGVGVNPRYWGTVRCRHERRCPQLFSGTRAPTADWPAWPGPGARHARYGAWCA